MKPDVVLYEENLNMDILNASVNYISQADMLIIGGTSLVVYPAAGLIRYYRGNKLVLVNKSETSADRQANLVIHDSIGKVFSQITLSFPLTTSTAGDNIIRLVIEHILLLLLSRQGEPKVQRRR